MKVVLAFSGGLDASFCVARLTRERGAEVTTVTGAGNLALGVLTARERRALRRRQSAFDRALEALAGGGKR